MKLLSGGEMIAQALEDEGVEFIFGYPGGAVLHIYDALFKASTVPHVLVRHEQAATHAADTARIPILTLSNREEVAQQSPWAFRLRTTAHDEVSFLVDYAWRELDALSTEHVHVTLPPGR